ncbi:polysaccharide lyase family 7 protein [Psychromonas arctica]|uniref:polysaccharide lyase family 7 protein n=1 Tax=Psychromonas arctica TaxID=168275 RepID=UPI002FCF9B81
MQLKTKLRYTTALVAAALSVTVIPAANAASVSITNAGFEDGFTSDSWVDTDPSSISSDERSGSKAAKISGDGGKFEQDVTVEANTDYELTAYIKGTGKIGATVDGTRYTRTGGGDDDYQLVTASFNSGSATTITIFGNYYGDEARFDDFALESTGTSESVSEESIESGTCSGNTSLAIDSATDDGTNDGHGPENAIDKNTSSDSRWSSKGVGKAITFDLGGEASVKELAIQWYKGSERSSYFDIETSTDNSNWSSVYAGGISSGSDTSYESIDVTDSEARYVRVTGSGNSAGSTWNSIVEAQILGCSDGEVEESITEDTTEETEESTVGETFVGSCNIDMSIWGYTTGDGVSMNDVDDIQDLVDNKTLGSNGAEEITWEDGCPTFTVANDAASSGGSTYPRSELRELMARYNDGGDANVKGFTKNNWVTSEASESNQDLVGGVDGNMKATLIVNTVSVDADSEDQIGRIIVGQIHGEDHEPVKIYYRKLPEHDKGSVFFTVDDSSGDPGDRINVIGFTDKNDTDEDASGDPVEPENGIALGDEWSYEIDLTGDQLKVTVWHDGYTYTTADSIEYTKTRSKQLIRVSSDTDAITIDDFYADDYMYFKAGLYNQNKTGTSSPDYASVTFKVIDVSH